MPLLSGLIVVVFCLLYLLLAQVYTIDVLFHQLADNELTASLIAVAGCSLLVVYAVVIWRRGRSRLPLRCLAAGALLLVLQVFAQGLARDIGAARLEARAAAIEAGIEIGGLRDAPLLNAAGEVVGIALSFSLVSAFDARLYLLPLLQRLEDGKGRGGLVFSSIKVTRAPAFEGAGPHYSKDEAYRLSFELVPSLFAWDPAAEAFCLRTSEARAAARIEEARTALARGERRFAIEISGSGVKVETQGLYDPAQMLEHILNSVPKPCHPQYYLVNEALHHPERYTP